MSELLQQAHPQWHLILKKALQSVSEDYLVYLETDHTWLPGINRLFASFSLPLDKTRYILLGESPYPRPQSANGYAFWDGAVGSLWSSNGLSKEVNRATSLRNWLKMLLTARGDLHGNTSQAAIAALDKSHYWQTGAEFFGSLVNDKGFLLLNASLVYSKDKVKFHAQQWRPFMNSLLTQLAISHPHLQLILLGKIAEQVPQATLFPHFIAEHPYNLSFINNPAVLQFFKPLDLLNRHD